MSVTDTKKRRDLHRIDNRLLGAANLAAPPFFTAQP